MIEVSYEIIDDQERRVGQWTLGKTKICFCVKIPIANFTQFKMYKYKIIKEVFYVKDENNIIIIFPSDNYRNMFRKFT